MSPLLVSLHNWQERFSALRARLRRRGGSAYIVAYAYDWFITQAYAADIAVVIAWIVIANTVPLKKVLPINRFFLDTDATLMYPTVETSDPVVSGGWGSGCGMKEAGWCMARLPWAGRGLKPHAHAPCVGCRHLARMRQGGLHMPSCSLSTGVWQCDSVAVVRPAVDGATPTCQADGTGWAHGRDRLQNWKHTPFSPPSRIS